MNNEDKVKILMERIRTLHQELKDNPQYTSDFVESITADIQYYQNEIDYIVNEMG